MTATIVNPRFENTVIISESEDDIIVWSDRRGCFFQISRKELLSVWRQIHAVWTHQIGRSCLAFGCGRDTFAYWVYKMTGVYYPASYLRTILEIGVALEWVLPSTSKCHYSVFNLRPIRYEHLL